MVSKRFYVKAGEAILPLGLLRHGLIATRAAPPCPLGQLVGFSPPRFSGPSRRGEGSPAEGRRSRPAAEPRRHAHGPHLLIFPTALQSLLRAAAARPRGCRRRARRNTLTRDGTKVAALDLLRPLKTDISAEGSIQALFVARAHSMMAEAWPPLVDGSQHGEARLSSHK